MADEAEWRERARRILIQNDRGGYTVPSSGLYPFQWNWDSAVVALGWMTFDEPRAWRELERLFEGQWDNGMVPHIVFRAPAETYFPGPAEWGVPGGNHPPTSSISQPPLVATMVRMMSERSRDPALTDRELARLLPKLIAWHQWWFRDRDPEKTGLAMTVHPWESGQDNSPAWDAPLAAVLPATRAYARRDTGFVDAARRPRPQDYDRYVSLMDFLRQAEFNPERIYTDCPYRVVDFGLNAILLRATEDLAELCRRHGESAAAAELSAASDLSRRALSGLWSESLGAYVSRDTRTGRPLEARTHSTFLAWYGRLVDSPEINRRLLGNLQDWMGRSAYGLASTHPGAPEFEPQRYWRGPVWPHLNWLIALGLAEVGFLDAAGELRRSTRSLIANAGFREYFNPMTGDGYGGSDFSWTAAVTLLWCVEEQAP